MKYLNKWNRLKNSTNTWRTHWNSLADVVSELAVSEKIYNKDIRCDIHNFKLPIMLKIGIMSLPSKTWWACFFIKEMFMWSWVHFVGQELNISLQVYFGPSSLSHFPLNKAYVTTIHVCDCPWQVIYKSIHSLRMISAFVRQNSENVAWKVKWYHHKICLIICFPYDQGVYLKQK